MGSFASLIHTQNTALLQFWTVDWIKPCPETVVPAQGLGLPPLRGAGLEWDSGDIRTHSTTDFALVGIATT